ncbi:MAG TPA: hypothetical protein V6D06_06660 [Trichocoleus sp.]
MRKPGDKQAILYPASPRCTDSNDNCAKGFISSLLLLTLMGSNSKPKRQKREIVPKVALKADSSALFYYYGRQYPELLRPIDGDFASA